MNLSPDTLAILKNFASINDNIYVRSGSTLKTMNESRTVIGNATVSENFETDFGVYSLSEFLNVMSLVPGAGLKFEENGNFADIKGTTGRAIRYYFSDPEQLTYPEKDITPPDFEVEFSLSADDMSDIRRAASAMNFKTMSVRAAAGETPKLVVTDIENSTAHTFELEPSVAEVAEVNYDMVFNIENFIFMPGGYDVSISSKLISRFKAQNAPVFYWVAVEKESQYG